MLHLTVKITSVDLRNNEFHNSWNHFLNLITFSMVPFSTGTRQPSDKTPNVVLIGSSKMCQSIKALTKGLTSHYSKG